MALIRDLTDDEARAALVNKWGIVGFHRFSQLRRGPTTNASCSRTAPVGIAAASTTADRTCSL